MIIPTLETIQLAVYIDFENLALWAEDENVELKISQIMEYLTGRGTVVIRRAYGDFGRFSKYRNDLMDNSIDMVQIFSFRSGKNLADIRMVVDAMEMVGSRPHINVFVVLSGDSDFTPLIARLREYGRYTIGIGPRKITHPLLVKGCDEFVYLETILGKGQVSDEKTTQMDKVAARVLLRKAIQAHGQRGELPVYASKLKHTLLSMNPAFNEANFGYAQFKNWLEDNPDIVKTSLKDMQLYVAPTDFELPGDHDTLKPAEAETQAQHAPPSQPAPPANSAPALHDQYQKVFHRLKMLVVKRDTRREILQQVYTMLQQSPAGKSADQVLEELTTRYEAQGLSKALLKQIWQMAFRQRAFEFNGQTVSVHAPVHLKPDLRDVQSFILRAEGSFIYAILYDELPVDIELLAEFICEDPQNTAYVEQILTDLEQRKIIIKAESGYAINRESKAEFLNTPGLETVRADLLNAKTPDTSSAGKNPAEHFARQAKTAQQKKDYANAAFNYLAAARLSLDALENNAALEASAESQSLEDLKYYLASYASSQAGHLYQNLKEYAQSRPYYLAFFTLVQNDTPLWSSLKRLIDPLLSYYWASAIREQGIDVNTWGVKSSDPIEIALKAARHETPTIRKQWQELTKELARVNPKLVNYIITSMKERAA